MAMYSVCYTYPYICIYKYLTPSKIKNPAYQHIHTSEDKPSYLLKKIYMELKNNYKKKWPYALLLNLLPLKRK